MVGWKVRVLVLGTVVLAGCAGSPSEPSVGADVASWEPDPCDLRGSHGLSGNAPVVAGLRGDEVQVARNITAAFGDSWIGTTSTVGFDDGSPPIHRYETAGGMVQVDRYADSDALSYSYNTFHGGYITQDIVETALERLGTLAGGLAGESSDGYGAMHQVWSGHDLDRTGVDWSTGQGDPAEDGRWGSVSIHGLHTLPGATDRQPAAQLREWAEHFGRCVAQREGATEADGFSVVGMEEWGYGVAHQSLVQSFGLTLDDPDPEAHCDTTGLVMEMDLETGAVAASFPYGCA